MTCTTPVGEPVWVEYVSQGPASRQRATGQSMTTERESVLSRRESAFSRESLFKLRWSAMTHKQAAVKIYSEAAFINTYMCDNN